MNSTIKNVLVRARKYFLFVLIIPLLLGALGYFIQGNQPEPTSATSTVKISLGSYNNAQFNDSGNVKLMITGNHFVSENFPDLTEEEISNIIQKLNVETINQRLISISYTGQNEEEALEVLENVTNKFLSLDKEEYQKRKEIVEGNLANLQGEAVSDDSKVDKQRFIYELENTLISMEEAKVTEPLSVTPESREELSPKKRAVLGVLIGITIMAGFIIIPEVFRKD